MKGDYDSDADHGHVYREAQPREEGTLIGAVVAGVGGGIREEKGGKKGKA